MVSCPLIFAVLLVLFDFSLRGILPPIVSKVITFMASLQSGDLALP